MSPNESAETRTAGSIRVQTPDGTFSSSAVAAAGASGTCALIVLQEIFGVTQKIRRYCELFACDGRAAIAPDLF